MNDDDLQSKQAYLRENVLEMGYDADEFMSFLQLKKGDDGLDLNNWQMSELISVVNDFVNTKKNIQNKNQEEETNKGEESAPSINMESGNKNIINNDISNNIDTNINNNIDSNINNNISNNINNNVQNSVSFFGLFK